MVASDSPIFGRKSAESRAVRLEITEPAECEKTEIGEWNQRERSRFDSDSKIFLYGFSESCFCRAIPPRAEGRTRRHERGGGLRWT